MAIDYPMNWGRGHETYHNEETHANSLADLDELALVGYRQCQYLSRAIMRKRR